LSVDLPHLHGILKDKTRASILELLEQRGRLGYVELQNQLEIPHTGKLNYHLKVLGDLISKDEQTGQYSLSEKGKVAVTLLGKFQAMAGADGDAIKARLKLGLALAVTVAMAALSIFFVVVGLPGSSDSVTLVCSSSSSNSCSAGSYLATSFVPTLFALIPLSLAAVAGFGFYRRKMILVWLATGVLLAFSTISFFSIGLLYIPFGIALIALMWINRRDPRISQPPMEVGKYRK